METAHNQTLPDAGRDVLSLPGTAMTRNAEGQPQLLGGHCGSCGAAHFPAVAVCPVCGDEAVEHRPLPVTGTVYSWTTVHTAPKRWTRPFTVAYVDLDNGVRVFTRLAAGVGIGVRVRLSAGLVGQQPDGTPIESFIFQSVEA